MSCPKPLNPFKYLSCPFSISLLIIVISTTSLISAYTAQFVFDMQPCILCLYQRIPFFITLAFGIIAFVILLQHQYRYGFPLIVLSGITFLSNSAIAFFHSGVERKWWKGFEGCSTLDMSNMSAAEYLNAIKNIKAVPCDEIPWSLLGLSMANYNVILCLGIGIICLVSSKRIYKRFKDDI